MAPSHKSQYWIIQPHEHLFRQSLLKLREKWVLVDAKWPPWLDRPCYDSVCPCIYARSSICRRLPPPRWICGDNVVIVNAANDRGLTGGMREKKVYYNRHGLFRGHQRAYLRARILEAKLSIPRALR
jgi:hypothetical protein